MITEERKKTEHYLHLETLPVQKQLLDFIKAKITLNSSPEKYRFVDELFELHRTSNGFDPNNLIKTRFLRLKATELKALLHEVNQEVGELYDTEEYKTLYSRFHSGNLLYEKLEVIRKKIEANEYANIDDCINDFKEHLNMTDSYQTVLAFYRFFQPYFNKKQIAPEMNMQTFNVR